VAELDDTDPELLLGAALLELGTALELDGVAAELLLGVTLLLLGGSKTVIMPQAFVSPEHSLAGSVTTLTATATEPEDKGTRCAGDQLRKRFPTTSPLQVTMGVVIATPTVPVAPGGKVQSRIFTPPTLILPQLTSCLPPPQVAITCKV